MTLTFTSNTISSDDPKYRRAGIIAFVTILDNYNKARIQKVCMSAMG